MTLYAVIWCDSFLGNTMLSLKQDSAGNAIQRAKDMVETAEAKGIALSGVRAVSLDDSDALTTLWPTQ